VDELEGGIQRTVDLADSSRGFWLGYNDISLKKKLDRSSVKITEALTTGHIARKVDIVLTNPQFAGTPAPVYIRISLRNVTVKQYSMLVMAKGDSVEDLSLDSEELFVLVVPGLGADQKPAQWFTHDLLRNQTVSGTTVPGTGDPDEEGIPDATDNCPETFNPTQADTDQDGIGDVCDPDIDGDKILNDVDNGPYVSNVAQADNDQDGEGDPCGQDDDNDGMPDAYEFKFSNQDPPLDPLVADGKLDFDNDGISNVDECRAGTNPYDANSAFRAKFIPYDQDTGDVEFPAVPGQTYKVYFTGDLRQDFQLLYTYVAKASGMTSLVVPSAKRVGFFVVVIE
jgi:hypothetical protein